MKIYLANHSKQKLGGGFSFLNYFSKHLGDKLTNDYEESDIYFISGCTMVDRDDVAKAKEDKKKIVLRVDNIPKNSRNRNTSVSRLRDFGSIADLVVYQSNWAKQYAGFVTKKDGPVIYNGVDTNIYRKDGTQWQREDDDKIYLYSRFNRDESKRPDEAMYYFHMYWRKNKNAKLWVMGKFGTGSVTYKFDLFANEPMLWLGVMDEPEQIAMFYRAADVLLVPYFNDACSNTVIEAMCCGCEIDTCHSGDTGGTPELLALGPDHDWSAERMTGEYIEELKKLV